MDKAQFEAQAHAIQTRHDKAVEEWNEGYEDGGYTWDKMREGIAHEADETLKSFRSLVNNYLYGVNSWAVWHPDGVRTSEEGEEYLSDLKVDGTYA